MSKAEGGGCQSDPGDREWVDDVHCWVSKCPGGPDVDGIYLTELRF